MKLPHCSGYSFFHVMSNVIIFCVACFSYMGQESTFHATLISAKVGENQTPCESEYMLTKSAQISCFKSFLVTHVSCLMIIIQGCLCYKLVVMKTLFNAASITTKVCTI